MGNSLFVKPSNFTIIDSEFIQIEYKLLPLILSLCGITFAFFQYTRNTYFLNKKWFFDKIYNEFVVQSFFEKGFSISYKIIDKGIIEIFGPKGFSNLVIKNSVEFSKFQTSNIYHYVYLTLSGITTIFIFRYIMIGKEYVVLTLIIVLYFYYFFKDSHNKNNNKKCF